MHRHGAEHVVCDRDRRLCALGKSAAPGSPRMEPRREPPFVEEKGMRVQRLWWRGLVAAVLGGLLGVTVAGAAGEQFLPLLSIREGAARFVGLQQANGIIDYVTLLNE